MKKKSKMKIVVGTFLIIFNLFTIFFVFKNSMEAKQISLEITKVEKLIEQENEEKLELKKEESYYKSDEYIEKIAREKLGLIKPEEILIINDSK